MTKDTVDTAIEILGKTYNIKCPSQETGALQRAAQFLNDQMRVMRESAQILSSDKIMVATALNIAHQLLMLEHNTLQQANHLQERLMALHERVEIVLSHMEPVSAE